MRLFALLVLLACAEAPTVPTNVTCDCRQRSEPPREYVLSTGSELVLCVGLYPLEHCRRLDGGWL